MAVRFRAAGALLATALLSGCATPGPPRAPSLNLPEPPKALAAERVGARVELSWTSTAETTDGGGLRGGITAVLCRGVAGPKAGAAGAVPACNPVQRFAVKPGADHAEELLPPALVDGPPKLIFYRVELLNAAGRSAGASGPLYTAAGKAPEPAGPLRLTPVKTGVEVRWSSPDAAGSVMRMTRVLTAAAPGSEAAKQAEPRASTNKTALEQNSDAAGGAVASSRRGTAAPESVVLEAGGAGSTATKESVGLVDPTVLDGGSYSYVAQRVRRVRLGGHDVELRGEPSPPASISFRQIFAPAAPAGLVAVPGGGIGQMPSVDLSWEPSTELTIAGYRVYRAQTGTSEFKAIGEMVTGPAFRDLNVLAGRTYRYHVTALDRLGNESTPSAEIKETVPAEDRR